MCQSQPAPRPSVPTGAGSGGESRPGGRTAGSLSLRTAPQGTPRRVESRDPKGFLWERGSARETRQRDKAPHPPGTFYAGDWPCQTRTPQTQVCTQDTPAPSPLSSTWAPPRPPGTPCTPPPPPPSPRRRGKAPPCSRCHPLGAARGAGDSGATATAWFPHVPRLPAEAGLPQPGPLCSGASSRAARDLAPPHPGHKGPCLVCAPILRANRRRPERGPSALTSSEGTAEH